MAQPDKEQRIIEIIANGQQFNASVKEMDAAVAVMRNQLKKMREDDPGRGTLIKEFNDLKARAKEAHDEMNGIAKAQSGFAGFIKESWSQAFGFFLGGGLIGITQQLWGLFTSSKTAFEESALINSQLEASLKSTGETAGVTKEMIEELASVQMGKTLFDDDATKGAASLLLTFTDIKNGVFQEALPAIQDMAQKMAGDGPADLKGATIQVGKALNDPIKGITALSKVGVSFTEEQKKVIKTMVETGDKAGAQRMILAELNKEFGGSAEAARKAGGGMAELKMQMGEAQEELGGFVHEGLEVLAPYLLKAFTFTAKLVGVLKEAPAFIKENKDLFIALGVAILGLQFNTAKTAAITLYHTAVEKGRAIATRISALEQWKLNAAFTANPIGFVITAVAALVGGFVILYNRSQTVRAGIAGIWEVLKNLGGRLADLFTGLATGNWSKVKAAFSNIGGSIADSFNQGYDEKIAKEEAERLKKEQAKSAQKKKDAAKQGEEEATAETEAQRKAREKAEKERQKAAKKAAEERERLHKEHLEKLKKAREEFNKAEADAELEYAKLKVEVMDEGIDKVLAKLKLQHDQELAEMSKHKFAVMTNIAATEEEKAAVLAQYNEAIKLKNQEYAKAQEEARKEDAKRKQEELFEELDKDAALQAELIENKFLTEQAALDDQLIRAIEAEQARDLALLEQKKATAQLKLVNLELAGQGETEQAVKLKNEILRIDKEKSDTIVKNEERVAKVKQELAQAQLGATKDALQLGIDFLSQDEAARKKHASAIKTLGVGKIMVDLAMETQAIWLNANSNPLNKLIPGFGTAMAIAQTILAVKRATGAAQQIQAQKFAVGGMTSRKGNLIPMQEVNGMWEMASGYSGGSIGAFADGGMVNDARLGLIGERGAELVIPNWMIRSPKYANTIGWLESERQRGVSAFAAGGSTTAEPVAAPVEVSGLSPGEQAILGAIQSMHSTVREWPTKLQVHNNVVDAAEKLQEYYDLQDQASG